MYADKGAQRVVKTACGFPTLGAVFAVNFGHDLWRDVAAAIEFFGHDAGEHVDVVTQHPLDFEAAARQINTLVADGLDQL